MRLYWRDYNTGKPPGQLPCSSSRFSARVSSSDLLHRVKRLSRFLVNEQVKPETVQIAFLSHTLARLGLPHRIGLTIDWTYFDAPTLRVQILKLGLMALTMHDHTKRSTPIVRFWHLGLLGYLFLDWLQTRYAEGLTSEQIDQLLAA